LDVPGAKSQGGKVAYHDKKRSSISSLISTEPMLLNGMPKSIGASQTSSVALGTSSQSLGTSSQPIGGRTGSYTSYTSMASGPKVTDVINDSGTKPEEPSVSASPPAKQEQAEFEDSDEGLGEDDDESGLSDISSAKHKPDRQESGNSGLSAD
jgi:hypothetical protein